MGTSPQDWSSWVRRAQHGLEHISEAAGGFAIVNTNDFAGGISKIVNELDNYYLLGFYPADTKTAGYRTLTLWTQSDLDAARRLYQAAGFRCVSKKAQPNFGRKDLVAETWQLTL